MHQKSFWDYGNDYVSIADLYAFDLIGWNVSKKIYDTFVVHALSWDYIDNSSSVIIFGFISIQNGQIGFLFQKDPSYEIHFLW